MKRNALVLIVSLSLFVGLGLLLCASSSADAESIQLHRRAPTVHQIDPSKVSRLRLVSHPIHISFMLFLLFMPDAFQ